jgi:natural product precursor
MKLNGKLSLNKETIAKLNDDQMNGVKGGLFSISNYCSRTGGVCRGKRRTKALFCNDNLV